MRADNTRHVIDAATRRSHDSRQRVLAVLGASLDEGAQPTVTDIATAAGVSRAYLYSQADLIAALRELQRANGGRPRGVPTGQRATPASLLTRIETLTARNKALREENSRLRHRLEVAHGLIRDGVRGIPQREHGGSAS